MRRITAVLLLFLFVFLWGIVKAGEVEEIFQAMQAHMDNIKTVKGKFKIESTSYLKEGDHNKLITGDYIYKNGDWKIKIKGKNWGEWVNYYIKELQKKGHFYATKFENEIVDKGLICLNYIDQQVALVQNKKMNTPYVASVGLFFAGILVSDYFGTPKNTYLRGLTEKGLCKIEVRVIEHTGIIQLDIKYLDEEGKERGAGVIEIDPLKQYSILKEEFKTEENGDHEQTGKIEFELVDPPGIYFSKKATFEIKQGKPLQTTDIKTFEFYETRIDEEIPDSELEIKLPAGVQVQDELIKEMYISFKEMTMRQILGGEWESVEWVKKPSEYYKMTKEIMEAVEQISKKMKEFIKDKSKARVSPSLMSDALYIPELIYDAGRLVDTDEITHTFEIYNRTDKPIGIKIQNYSCSVTTATLSSESIPAGGKTLLTAKINTAGYKGEIEARVEVATAAPDLNEYSFYLKGFVSTGVKCVPAHINLGNLEYGKKYKQTIKIEAYTGKPLKIKSYHTDNEMVNIVKVIDKEDCEYEKFPVVEIVPTQCGKITGNLWFNIDDDSSTVITAKIEGEVVRSSDIHPAGIFLAGKANNSGEIKIPLKYSIETVSSFITLEKAITTGEASVYKYNVQVPESEKKRFGKAGEIKVKNENNEVVHTIPVFY